jgi:hypothetical protein
MIYLITGSDEGYYQKIVPYLDSISTYSPFKNVLLTVGFIKESPYSNVEYAYVPKKALTDITTNPCVQAGEWLQYFPIEEDDIVIFTDGDIRMQRAPTEDEIRMIESVEQLEVLAGPNATHSGNTLINELHGLKTTWSDEQINTVFDYAGVSRKQITLNMGVLICRYYTYRRIRNTTYDIFAWFPTVTEHMARQQWFMNLAIYAQCQVLLLPFTFHSHPHNGTQEGLNFRGSEIYIKDTKVLFNHKYGV